MLQSPYWETSKCLSFMHYPHLISTIRRWLSWLSQNRFIQSKLSLSSLYLFQSFTHQFLTFLADFLNWKKQTKTPLNFNETPCNNTVSSTLVGKRKTRWVNLVPREETLGTRLPTGLDERESESDSCVAHARPASLKKEDVIFCELQKTMILFSATGMKSWIENAPNPLRFYARTVIS